MGDSKKAFFKEFKTFNLSIRDKRMELYTTWQDLFSVAKALVEQAKANPLSVKGTVLSNCVRILSMSSKMLAEMDTFKKEVEDALDRYDQETGEEIMTEDERQMMEDYKEMTAGMENTINAEDSATPTTINDDSHFNFRRDQ